jgi:hypothetical protein
MGRIYDAMKAFMQADDWPHSEVNETTLRTGFNGKNGKYSCFARAREEQDQFAFYSQCQINAPEDRRAAVAEFITRANYGMIIGNFEMDFSDGEIRYKTSVDVEGTELNAALLKQLFYANVYMMDKYLPGLMKVCFAGADPAEAIAEIENPTP